MKKIDLVNIQINTKFKIFYVSLFKYVVIWTLKYYVLLVLAQLLKRTFSNNWGPSIFKRQHLNVGSSYDN